VLARLNQDLAEPAGDRPTLLARLKSPDRGNHGLKGDGIAYEIVANALLESAACRRRTRALLHAVSHACEGKQTDYFNLEQRQVGVPRLVFTP
jgi:hypothetical protein